jgi:hypothetical protein
LSSDNRETEYNRVPEISGEKQETKNKTKRYESKSFFKETFGRLQNSKEKRPVIYYKQKES